MEIKTEFIELSTRGHSDIVDITDQVQDILVGSGLKEGQITVFASGSTAAITTIEYEPGLVQDIPEILDRIAPEGAPYHHDATWGDGNGNSHVPFVSGQLLLGTWQQIVLIDCDNRSRKRKVPVQLIGKE